jgi:carbamate kinase
MRIAGSASNTGSAARTSNKLRLLPLSALLMLTDVDGVYLDWGTSKQSLLKRMTPADTRKQEFASRLMGPKVKAAAVFAGSGGQLAGISRLQDARAILEAKAGTIASLKRLPCLRRNAPEKLTHVNTMSPALR